MTTLFDQKQRSAASVPSVVITVILALISMAVSGYAAYSRNDKTIAERITVVETQQKDDRTNTKDALQRIENKLDNFIEYQTGRKP